ncbi:MAG TPA: PadR family transcriptional regulator [Candidatus Evtepia faecigallinarum]|nr:PadR family transcriptional regulator [Candidatus Evtepia faecigallinarum]
MIPSQMLKGVLQGSVLAILGQKETYGYEIVQDLTAYGFGHVAEGTVYPLLLRLEKGGLVQARFVEGGSGPRRKYYALTDRGREELAAFRASFWEMTAAVTRLPGFGEEEEGR